MAGRAVVLGATGTQGGLAARALARRGVPMLLAGRTSAKLADTAAALRAISQAPVEEAVADVTQPDSLRALVGPGDVLLTTVGPFARLGRAAVEAAIAAGATYVDANGEPGFTRLIFEHYGPQAESAGCALLPGMANGFVPGNLAGALALQQAGDAAVTVEIGYFLTGPFGPWAGSSQALGTWLEAVTQPSYTRRGGRIVTERVAAHARVFTVDGRHRVALPLGTTEHFTLPRLHPELREVEVCGGLAGSAGAVLRFTPALTSVTHVWPVGRGFRSAARVIGRYGAHPSEEVIRRVGIHVVAVARSRTRAPLAETHVTGTGTYEFSGELLAWAAHLALDGHVRGTGALGPIEAFGLDEVQSACAAAGVNVTRAHLWSA